MHDDAFHTAIMDDVITTEPFAIDTGEAVFKIDGDSVTLYVNGWASSEWSQSRPDRLEFEYMNWMLAAAEAFLPADARLRCLHLGAGACALPRAIAHRWPRSRHLAVEIDAKLAAAVRAQVALPRAPVLRIRVDDAAATLFARPAASQDLIVRDVFDRSGRTPDSLVGFAAAQAAGRALAEGGLYLANCGVRPGLPEARLELRALADVFEYVAVIAEPGQWRGRRPGNAALAASNSALTEAGERDLARRLAGGGFPARLLAGPEARRWSS
ncbi:MAG: fused MFS/spermidine synthase [Bifidobacteriaceae bacterium]|nr:fused MFS/spermidine synthase [Bifidobacteriaceae bacterium]